MAEASYELSPEISELIERLAPIAADAKCIAVMTGAGVSAESEVPTFREAQTGLWAKYDPVMLASVEGFMNDPAQVWRWYDERRQTMKAVEPNPGHYAFAQWEQHWRSQRREFQLLTQNIDNLHGRAGSTDIIELHGNIWHVRPLHGPISDGFLLEECPLTKIPPTDGQGRMLRPHVVWFGEQLDPLTIEAAFDWAGRCDLMLVAGTSAVVYPAAAVPYEAKRRGATVVEINPVATELTRFCDFALAAPSGEVLPALWERVQGLARGF
jgi:NAD-dependent deacetylase